MKFLILVDQNEVTHRINFAAIVDIEIGTNNSVIHLDSGREVITKNNSFLSDLDVE